jgi:glyoxylase-like metal-dependent hydrolase (beta-lactamase superfamily II)
MTSATTSPPRYDLGGCTVTLLSGGSLKLDGGAMFGIIPKALWLRNTPADEQNRIQLACNCLLVEWQRETARRVIIETGHGPKYADKEQRMFAIDPTKWLLPELQAVGVDPASITDVIVSHLHFDHAGGLTYQQDGRLLPTFPNARVHVQRRELEDARDRFGVMTATYREENFQPIDQTDRWNLLAGEMPILDDVISRPMPGHTRGHHGIIVTGRDRALVFGGDTVPTAAHLGAPYNMGYDLFPLENRESKRQLLQWVAQRNALLVFDHEPRTPVVRIVPDGEWFRAEPA